MELSYFTHRGYHHWVCQLCGKRERERIPDQAPEEYRHNPGNPVLAFCPNCNHGVGTARIVLNDSPSREGSHKAQYSGDDDGEALSYDRLPEPWREWAKIAKNFVWQLDDQQDREDLMHNIIVRVAEVAEEYRRQGRSLSKWGAIKVAEYTRLRFYHQKKRWKRVSSVSLNSVIQDEDGYETEMIQTLVDQKRLDLDAWLDFKNYYQNSPEKTKRAVRKLVRENWRTLSGYDWKLIRQFRTEFKE